MSRFLCLVGPNWSCKICDSNGWQAPGDVTTLLAESSRFGAVINSWSWGDNTEDYTDRSQMIDGGPENPWSLVFVAPGNGNDARAFQCIQCGFSCG